MVAPRMIRCINGHVFDVTSSESCPVCGWTQTPVVSGGGAGATGGDERKDDPGPDRRMIVIAVAAVLLLAGGSGLAIMLNMQRGAPDAPKSVDARPAETRPAESKPAETRPPETRPVETKAAETKAADIKPAETRPADPKTVVLPDFKTLQPLAQTEQIAAADSLGLSPFAKETALVQRATLLAGLNPMNLDMKRMLVEFVRAGHPLALTEAGAACYFGYAVRVDDQAALDYVTRAADQGVVRGRLLLNQMILAGRGRPRDRQAAGDLLILAIRAEAGGPLPLMAMLKSLDRSLDGAGPTTIDLQRAVMASDWTAAIALARALAEVKIAAGYVVLGERHWQGDGLEKNQAMAIDYWKKAVRIGYSNASQNMAFAARNPPSGSANISESMVWLLIGFLQAEDKPRSDFFRQRVMTQVGLLDPAQWRAIRTLFQGLAIPGPG